MLLFQTVTLARPESKKMYVPPTPAAFIKQMGVKEFFNLAQAAIDRDSYYGGSGAATKMENKVKRLDYRFKKEEDANGRTEYALGLEMQHSFWSAGYAIVLRHIDEVKSTQFEFNAAFHEISSKWERRKKVPDFIESVVAKYLVYPITGLGGYSTVISGQWGKLVEMAKSLATKPEVKDAIELASNAIGLVGGLVGTYYARKWLINLATSIRSKLEGKKTAEMKEKEAERQTVLQGPRKTLRQGLEDLIREYVSQP